MHSIINSNYKVEDHFLTKMYEGECDIESNSNGIGSIKKFIEEKANKTSDTLKTINEDIKKIKANKENKTTNINIKISYNLLTQIAKMIHDFFFSNKNNKQNEQQTNN